MSSRGTFKAQAKRGRIFPVFGSVVKLVVAVALTAAVWSVALAAPGAATNDGVAVEVSRIGDATHLEFSGRAEWKYDLKRDKSGGDRLVLRLPSLKPEALAKLKSHNDALIRNVQVKTDGVDGAVEISFGIGAGTDYFDYIADQPSRLVVDFFPAEAKPQAQPEKPQPVQKARQPAIAEDDEEEDDEEESTFADKGPPKGLPAKKSARNPAGGDFVLVAKGELPQTKSVAEEISSHKDFKHGIFDGGDPEFRRFIVKDYEVREDAQIASRANFYLPFPMLELGNPQMKALIANPPAYEIVPGDTDENKEARVLLTLFAEKKRALFLKSADDFLKQHAKSPYDEIVRNMMADTYYELWRLEGDVADFDKATAQYLQLVEKYPTSPITPRTLLLLGYNFVERGDSFAALKAFQRFTRMNPKSKHIDRVNVAIAEAYLKLNRFDDTLGMLNQIEKEAKTDKGKEDAAFRKGDVFFKKKDYAEAIRQYKAATKAHPQAAARFPNAYYNTAEAEFVTHKYRDSIESYRQFVQRFPDHDHGGYAMTRMGELLGILGTDPKRAQGAFMESFFRYRATPGAGIARIRLLTSRMPEMKEKELANALFEIDGITQRYAYHPLPTHTDAKKKTGEAKEIDAKNEIAEVASQPNFIDDPTVEKNMLDDAPTRRKLELAGIDEFSTLLIADGLAARKEYDRSNAGLISFYQKNPQSPNRERFKQRIVRNMTEAIRVAVEKGDFIEALRRYSKESAGWLKNSERVDLVYYVAQAYEQAGVLKDSSTSYRETLKRLQAIKGGPSERERAVFERLPKPESVRLRLAAVAAKNKEFATAETELKAIPAQAVLSEPEQIERAEVSAEVAEARGQGESARKYLSELIAAWKGDPKLTSALHLRIARLNNQARRYKDADAHLRKILDYQADGAGISEEIHAGALEMRADVQVAMGKKSEAIKSYRELLVNYEAKRPLASVRYRLGQLLYDVGDLKGAETVWSELNGDKAGLWRRLAMEQMQSAKWQNEYKKYLDRIPAAADIRESETR